MADDTTPNIVDFLTGQHKEINRLFRQFPDNSDPVAHKIADLLMRHTQIENRLLYPFVLAHVDDGQRLFQAAHSDHENIGGMAQQLVSDFDDDEQFEELKKAVKAHMKLEEDTLFPALTAALGEDMLVDLGEQAEKSVRSF